MSGEGPEYRAQEATTPLEQVVDGRPSPGAMARRFVGIIQSVILDGIDQRAQAGAGAIMGLFEEALAAEEEAQRANVEEELERLHAGSSGLAASLTECGFVSRDGEDVFALARRALREYHDDKRAMQDVIGGSFWMWQGDGYDHLETLSCPVVISAQALEHMRRVLAYAIVTYEDFGVQSKSGVSEEVLARRLSLLMHRFAQGVPDQALAVRLLQQADQQVQTHGEEPSPQLAAQQYHERLQAEAARAGVPEGATFSTMPPRGVPHPIVGETDE